ncbi:MAG: AAA+ family ATPase, partial [Cyanobacteriota bacterium]|nr:AAA+ family ATPase [Cyanobacteriota bacterium]
MSSLLATTLTEIQRYRQEMEGLLIYGDSFQDRIGQAFRQLLVGLSGQPAGPVAALYGAWFQALAETGQPWQSYVIEQVLLADNPFTRQVQHQGLERLPPALVEAVSADLTSLESLYQLDPQQVATWVAEVGELPRVPV